MFEQHDRVAQWVSEHVGAKMERPYVGLGISGDDGQTLCGGIIFNNWNGFNIDVTLALTEPLTRPIIQGVWYYVFEQSKATRVTARTMRSNKKTRELLPRLGFKFEAVSPRWYGPDRKHDAFQFALFPENARFYNAKP